MPNLPTTPMEKILLAFQRQQQKAMLIRLNLLKKETPALLKKSPMPPVAMS